MNLSRAVQGFVSARTTVVLLAAMAALLLLNVTLPQVSVLGEEALDGTVAGRPWARFLLVDLGLGNLPTSPVFLSVLGLFFLNLAAVLASRIRPTWRRIAIGPRSEKGLERWSRLEESLVVPRPDDWSVGDAVRTLRGHGYQTRRAGDHSLFGVRHRTAPLGFLLFHLSFFLLCAGGVLIYYTRFVGSAVLAEGQEFRGDYTEIVRSPPVGDRPNLEFILEQVVPVFESGEPVHLGAVFRLRQGSSTVAREARVNDPADWGDAIILIHQAGLAPVLWLQDDRGFTLDRVVAPVRTRGGDPTVIPLGDGVLAARVHPLSPGATFPSRSELAGTTLDLEVLEGDRQVFRGALSPGHAADLEAGGRLVLEEIRYWVGFRVISERGGGALIAGFVAGVSGLIWRLGLYRREVAVTWDDREVRVVGRGEYFTRRFREELRAISDALAGSALGRR